jgi:beta-fructofuranosidase
MYKALNPELTDWQYIGSPFEGQEENWECPNFFKVGDKFVLIYSPHGRVEYYTGNFDVDNVKFTAEYHGLIDNGAEWNYYAPNTLQKDDGRRILFGWIPGFKTEQGWQGAISLPRDLSVDQKGRLIQKPLPELNKLRHDLKNEKDIVLTNTSKKLDIEHTQFEMEINIGGDGAKNLGFRFNDEKGNPFEIMLTPETIFLGEEPIKVEPVLDEKIRQVRLFFDRTIIEIFVNDGLLCATKVIYPDNENLNFEVFNKGEKISIAAIDIWNMSSIWQ